MNEKPDLSTLFNMVSNNVNLQSKGTSNSSSVQTPESILKMAEKIKANNTSNEKSNQNNMNDMFSMLSEMLNNKNNSSPNINDTNNMPDPETLMKITKAMKLMNQDTPSKELLLSLKPFLNDTRKEKIDQCIKMLGVTKIIEILKWKGWIVLENLLITVKENFDTILILSLIFFLLKEGVEDMETIIALALLL